MLRCAGTIGRDLVRNATDDVSGQVACRIGNRSHAPSTGEEDRSDSSVLASLVLDSGRVSESHEVGG